MTINWVKSQTIQSLVLKIVTASIVFVLLRQFYIDISNFPDLYSGTNLYESWGISDWLINYQGGFVRRGLAGELLYQLYQIHPYPVLYVIICLSAISLIALTYLCVRLYREMNWPIALLLFPMFLFNCFYGLEGILSSRRDGLMLLLVFFLFSQYRRYLNSPSLRILLIIWFTSVLIILLHEGVMFAVFPFLILHSYIVNNLSLKEKINKIVLLWWPFVIALFTVIICHGNEKTPILIWQSWMPCFHKYSYGFDIPQIGVAVNSMKLTFYEGLNMCFSISWLSDFVKGIPVWPFNIYTIFAIYYLFTRMELMSKKGYLLKNSRIQMSNIILVQLIFILPILGFIADDWYRFVPYCCVTSCFLCYLYPERFNVPSFIDNFSVYISNRIDNISLFKNSWFYLLVLISLPLCQHNARPGGMFPFIPLEMKGNLLESIIEWI